MRLTFGDFEIDLQTREFRKDGVAVPMQPLVFDLLCYLIEHRDRVVPKEELLQQVWGGVMVGKAAISQAVSVLRHAVEDSGPRGALIRTAHGRGYRFVGEINSAWAGEAPTPDGDRRLKRPPFVGREEVKAIAHRALDEALEGRASLVLLSGEPGIGKTRACEEIARLSRHRHFTTLPGRGLESEDAPPYWPWHVTIEQALSHPWARGVLSGRTRQLLARAFRGLDTLVEEEQGDDPEDPLDAEPGRFELFNRMADLLASLAEVRPLLVVLEDIHAADTSSLELLEVVLRRTAKGRIVFVSTFREAAVARDAARSALIARLAARPRCVSVRLGRLQTAHVAEFVRPWTTGKPAPSLVSALSERSGGNPLLLKHLVALCVAQSGTLDGVERAAIPPGRMAAVVDRHLGVVSTSCREVLAAAAVLGSEIDVALLSMMLEQPREDVLKGLAEAVRAEILLRTSTTRLQFSHSVIRDVLYDGLPADTRAALHARTGEAIIAAGAGEERIGELAHHFRSAGTAHAERAVTYSQRAARAAMRSLAFEEAVRHASAALDLVAGADGDRLELLLLLGEALMNLGELGHTRERHHQALTIARRLDRTREIARAAYGIAVSHDTDVVDEEIVRVVEEAVDRYRADDPLRVRLLIRLANARWLRDPPEVARRLARQAIEAGRRVGDPDALALALTRALRVWHGAATMIRKRAALAAELVAVLPRVRGPGAHLECRWHLLWSALERGDRREFDRNVDGMLKKAAENRHPFAAWNASVFRASRLHLAGRFADAEAEVDRGRALPAQGGEAFREHVRALQMLALRLAQGRFVEHLEAYRRHVTADKPMPWKLYLHIGDTAAGRRQGAEAAVAMLMADELRSVRRDMNWLCTLCALADLGVLLENREAAALVYRLLAPYEAHHVLIATAWMYLGSTAHYLGKLAALLGRWDDALRYLRRAIERDQRMGARPFVALGRYEYARALLARGDRGAESRARPLLGQALTTAINLDMARLRADAEGLLTKC